MRPCSPSIRQAGPSVLPPRAHRRSVTLHGDGDDPRISGHLVEPISRFAINRPCGTTISGTLVGSSAAWTRVRQSTGSRDQMTGVGSARESDEPSSPRPHKPGLTLRLARTQSGPRSSAPNVADRPGGLAADAERSRPLRDADIRKSGDDVASVPASVIRATTIAVASGGSGNAPRRRINGGSNRSE